MIKTNKESSKKYDPLSMLAYKVYEEFVLYERILISVFNTTSNNMYTHAQMYIAFSFSSLR